MNDFIIKNNGKVSHENKEDLLFGLEKYWQNNFDRRIEKTCKKYENEIENLKR